MSPRPAPQFVVKSPIDGANVRIWDSRDDAERQAAYLSRTMGRTYTVWPANHSQSFSTARAH